MLDLNSKTLLVSIRRIDESGQESFDTFFGNVVSFSETTVFVKKNDGTDVSLPYDEDVYKPAEPGFYELKNGSTFENPDIIVQWTVFASESAAKNFQYMNR